MFKNRCSQAEWDDETDSVNYCTRAGVGVYEVWVDRTTGGVYTLCADHVIDAEDAQPPYYIFREVRDADTA